MEQYMAVHTEQIEQASTDAVNKQLSDLSRAG